MSTDKMTVHNSTYYSFSFMWGELYCFAGFYRTCSLSLKEFDVVRHDESPTHWAEIRMYRGGEKVNELEKVGITYDDYLDLLSLMYDSDVTVFIERFKTIIQEVANGSV